MNGLNIKLRLEDGQTGRMEREEGRKEGGKEGEKAGVEKLKKQRGRMNWDN